MSSSFRCPVVETGVTARSGRRRLTVGYKTWLVQEAERIRGSGNVGAILRREGVYSSQLATWRKQYCDRELRLRALQQTHYCFKRMRICPRCMSCMTKLIVRRSALSEIASASVLPGPTPASRFSSPIG